VNRTTAIRVLSIVLLLVIVCPIASAQDGFVAVVDVFSPSPGQIINFSTKVTVPPKPHKQGTVYVWPGVQPAGEHYLPISLGVLQPVLTWGPSCPPGILNSDTIYNSWHISGEYVNPTGSVPGHIGCQGGQVLDVKPGDELLLTLKLHGTTWVQSINDLTTRQVVSYELDMMGQEQNLGLFAIETYNDGHIDGEVVFRKTLITFSEPNTDNCSSRYRASNAKLSPPVMSDDGLTCFIEYVTLGGKSSYLSQDGTYETQDDTRSPKIRTAMAKAYRTLMATTRAVLRDTATMILGLRTKS
jgi:hypothetical protein